MESFFEEKGPEKKGVNKGYIIGAVIGVLAIAAVIAIISLRPPVEDRRASILEDALREGSPEFAELTKDVIIATDLNRTVESPTGLGKISMYISGSIRNRGTRTITVLEVNAAVIDQQNNVVKDKNVLVIPERFGPLGPGEVIQPVTLALEGFEPKADRANIRWKVVALKAE
ncbi:MAG TPA: FxLYD domain-containing protein [Pyrinomonadaceae bacterium]|nr:FxLYD domain-containing protein [Pyrinomonadaceae bacterium]